jgi:hypothetical protein
MATFTNNSLNVTLPEPDLLLTELATHVDFVSAGTVEGKNVLGVAYNKLNTLVGTMVSLSAELGVKFRVDQAYNNQQMGIILQDRSVCLFTALTARGETTRQGGLTASSFDHSYEEIRRLKTLGYI